MTIFQRNITMSLICKDDETLRRTSVRKLKPLAFNLNLIQQLSELSWLPVDNNVSIAEMEQAFRSMVRTKRFSRWTDLLLVSVGNAAFCRLFNGDRLLLFLVTIDFVLVCAFAYCWGGGLVQFLGQNLPHTTVAGMRCKAVVSRREVEWKRIFVVGPLILILPSFFHPRIGKKVADRVEFSRAGSESRC